MTKIENFTKALIQKKTQKPQDSYILNFPNQKKKKKKSQTPEKKNQTRKIKSRKPKRKKIYIYRKKNRIV